MVFVFGVEIPLVEILLAMGIISVIILIELIILIYFITKLHSQSKQSVDQLKVVSELLGQHTKSHFKKKKVVGKKSVKKK